MISACASCLASSLFCLVLASPLPTPDVTGVGDYGTLLMKSPPVSPVYPKFDMTLIFLLFSGALTGGYGQHRLCNHKPYRNQAAAYGD